MKTFGNRLDRSGYSRGLSVGTLDDSRSLNANIQLAVCGGETHAVMRGCGEGTLGEASARSEVSNPSLGTSPQLQQLLEMGIQGERIISNETFDIRLEVLS